jgi:hypothetical protein
MFTPDSRYAKIETATWTGPDGRSIAYVRRRFLPRQRDLAVVGEVTIAAGDRLDLIAQRTVGSATKYWLVCDANEAMNPASLTERPGETLTIAGTSG